MQKRSNSITISYRSIAVAMVAIVVVGMTAAAMIPENQAEKEVREAIGLYFKGAETAEATHFEEAFALGAADMTFVRKDRETGVESIRRVPIEDAIKGWTSESPEKTWGEITDVVVLDDRLAHVTLDILWRGTIYTDVMSLYKVNDSWKIVNKTFVVKERMGN